MKQQASTFKTILKEFQQRLIKEYWGHRAAGILCFSKDTKRFLIALRSSQVHQPNTWGIIGGKIDPKDKSYLEGASREFKEESGFNGEISSSLLYTFKDPAEDFEYYTFLGIVPQEFTPKSQKEHAWETSKFKWVSLEELLKISPKHTGLEETLSDKTVISKLEKLVDKH
jgi:8-oxo-dGTP pyrophosphatase MutT (NUDIX family)